MKRFHLATFSLALLFGCSLMQHHEPDFHTPTPIVASYYGGTDGFDGKLTANGEPFDSNDLTAAHKSLPFGTILKLTNPHNGRQCLVRINDRGPYISGRDLDLSKQAAWELGFTRDGVTDLIAQLR